MSMYLTGTLNVPAGMQAAQNFDGVSLGLGATGEISDFQAMLQQLISSSPLLNTGSETSNAVGSAGLFGLLNTEEGANAENIAMQLMQQSGMQMMQSFGFTEEKSDGSLIESGLTNYDALKALTGKMQDTDLTKAEFKAPDMAAYLMESAKSAQTEETGRILSQISSIMKQQQEDVQEILGAAAMMPKAMGLMNATFANTDDALQSLKAATGIELPVFEGTMVPNEARTADTAEKQTAGFDAKVFNADLGQQMMQAEGATLQKTSYESTAGQSTEFENIGANTVIMEKAENLEANAKVTKAETASTAENVVKTESPVKAENLVKAENTAVAENVTTAVNAEGAANTMENGLQAKVQSMPTESRKEGFETLQNFAAGNAENTQFEVIRPEAAKAEEISRQPYMQVSEQIEKSVLAGKDEFTMELSPAGLGSISVKLMKMGEKLSITIAAVNPETHKLLLSQADKLAQNLGLSNVQVETLQIRQDDSQPRVVESTDAGQRFDASADTTSGHEKDQSKNAYRPGNHHFSSDADEVSSLEEMSETYRMLRDRIGMLNYLA